VIYTQPQEGREIRRYIDFLRSQGFLKGDTEVLDVEELPGVQGLKAFRVEIDLNSPIISERAARIKDPEQDGLLEQRKNYEGGPVAQILKVMLETEKGAVPLEMKVNSPNQKN
jgi:hypothetical protein